MLSKRRELNEDELMNIEREIGELAREENVRSVPATISRTGDSPHAFKAGLPGVEAVIKATSTLAEMLRTAVNTTKDQRETLAQQYEHLGDGIKEAYYEVAKQVRELQAEPERHSEELAAQVEKTAQEESDRQNKLMTGLLGASSSIKGAIG
jgi:DNA anti-recombination protein RmuC